ncbi:MAG TPA: septum formation initiator family protein [Longimicrobiales bacterium]|nr:septum formation initiator family protein [Longimicrobiales bacterium]
MIRKVVAGVILTATAYFFLFGGEYTFLDLWRLKQEQAREAAELEAVRAEADHLEVKVDSLATDSAALERLARERFGLIRDGERLYRFAAPDTTPGADTDSAPGEDGGGGGR